MPYTVFTGAARTPRANPQPCESVDEARSVAQPTDPRRAAFQAGWDARILPLLTDTWQSSLAVAKALDEKPATVLERLKDMLERGLVERKIVKAAASKPTRTGKRPRVHTARLEAHFRLPQG